MSELPWLVTNIICAVALFVIGIFVGADSAEDYNIKRGFMTRGGVIYRIEKAEIAK